jgi:uncharacterized membrane protein YdbT with pleckstrin-like domain
MLCAKCRAELPDGSAFCNRCGSPTAAAAGPSLAAPPPAASEPEEDLWRGRFSGKAQAHWWLLWLVGVAGVVYVWFGVLSDAMKSGPVARWVCVGAIVLPAVVILWGILVEKLCTRYRLTTHRLFKETGIISRHLNEIELVRVDDVSVRQNVIQRIFNVGVITVIAPTDQTEPRLEIVGIQDPIEVKEKIRAQVRKRRERSLHVESL